MAEGRGKKKKTDAATPATTLLHRPAGTSPSASAPRESNLSILRTVPLKSQGQLWYDADLHPRGGAGPPICPQGFGRQDR